MNTGIYVYRPTSLNIFTCEGDLELCEMYAGATPLARGDNTTTVARGIYKIASSQEIQITGDASAFEVVTNTKTNVPKPPPLAIQQFAPLNTTEVESFMAGPDARELLSF